MKPHFQRGDLLIASTALIDPNFARTVVLICEHDGEKGTYGLVLNRPVDITSEVAGALPFTIDRLFQGGPVRPDALQVLHPYGSAVPGSLDVLPGFSLGGDFSILSAGFESGELDLQRCRFFIGYSGWEKDQLAREFTEESWLLVHGEGDMLERTAPADLWAAAIRLYGRGDALFKHFPSNPNLN
jgi:putative transcriptional regulator